jgi:hypothetical protein
VEVAIGFALGAISLAVTLYLYRASGFRLKIESPKAMDPSGRPVLIVRTTNRGRQAVELVEVGFVPKLGRWRPRRIDLFKTKRTVGGMALYEYPDQPQLPFTLSGYHHQDWVYLTSRFLNDLPNDWGEGLRLYPYVVTAVGKSVVGRRPAPTDKATGMPDPPARADRAHAPVTEGHRRPLG